ncbi:MAG TPA: iron ABC transporter substrate-binding protein [Thermoleophilaceae bacterium]
MRRATLLLLVLAALVPAACGDDGDSGSGKEKLTIYSGRNETLIGPLLAQFEKDTGVDVEVRYGDSAELAATLSEEGENSPAGLFYSQDAGALGAVAERGLLEDLPPDLVGRVEARFRDDEGRWVGVSARARVLAYSTKRLEEADLPQSVFDLTGSRWKGKLGLAPPNASFQAFVSGMRVDVGDERTRKWLEAIDANDPKLYENNIQAVEAIANGEIDAALVNHYYLYEIRREQGDDVPVENHFFRTGDPGSLVNTAGVGILKSGKGQEAARKLVDYLLSERGQRYFAEKTAEYPLAAGVKPGPDLRPLKSVQGPFIDLGILGEKLPSTLEMIEEAGLTN